MKEDKKATVGVLIARVGYMLAELSSADQLLVVSLVEVWVADIKSIANEDMEIRACSSEKQQQRIH